MSAILSTQTTGRPLLSMSPETTPMRQVSSVLPASSLAGRTDSSSPFPPGRPRPVRPRAPRRAARPPRPTHRRAWCAGVLLPRDLAAAGGAAAVPPSRRLLAVPFVGKDTPSRASEFSHPDVVIALTILAFRYEGLRRSDLLTVLARLRRHMARQYGPYHKREACRRFVERPELSRASPSFARRRGCCRPGFSNRRGIPAHEPSSAPPCPLISAQSQHGHFSLA